MGKTEKKKVYAWWGKPVQEMKTKENKQEKIIDRTVSLIQKPGGGISLAKN